MYPYGNGRYRMVVVDDGWLTRHIFQTHSGTPEGLQARP